MGDPKLYRFSGESVWGDYYNADEVDAVADHALQTRIERLEAALNNQRNKLSLIVQINPDTDSDPLDALRQAVELAKAALEAE